MENKYNVILFGGTKNELMMHAKTWMNLHDMQCERVK